MAVSLDAVEHGYVIVTGGRHAGKVGYYDDDEGEGRGQRAVVYFAPSRLTWAGAKELGSLAELLLGAEGGNFDFIAAKYLEALPAEDRYLAEVYLMPASAALTLSHFDVMATALGNLLRARGLPTSCLADYVAGAASLYPEGVEAPSIPLSLPPDAP